jgi:formate hydrogenlyase subunit 6/NADH:ubiquinone oxidoreductase subunit I
MLKRLDRSALDQLLAALATDYRLLTPQRLIDGTRLLRPHGEGNLSLQGEPVQRKPTEAFFPQHDPLLWIGAQGEVKTCAAPVKPLALFGLNAADLACIAFTDRFFAAPPADDHYLARRQGALLIGLTGQAGPGGDFLALAEGLCDLELLACGGSWLGVPWTARGKALMAGFPDGDQDELEKLRETDRARGNPAQDLLERAAGLVASDAVPDDFWREIGDRCILCSGCNLVCPTCTCFCVEDRQEQGVTLRSRVWDSCQFDAFMREASGHNPLGTEALRTRRRIHHKLAADVTRWGESGCLLCGRCDRVCPTGIGIQAVAAEILARFGHDKLSGR